MQLERVLVVDDDDDVRRTIADLLSGRGYQILGVSSLYQAREALQREAFDLVLCDLRLDDGSGLELLRELRGHQPRIHAILMTGYASMETAVEAVRLGLADYLIKPVLPAQLDFAIQRLENVAALASENRYLRQQLEGPPQPEIVWGKSPLMREIHELVKKVAATEATVLIQGESGTGKEVVAHTICQYSPRAGRPFVKVNCAAVPEALLESEFFGHERGAFTGAVQRREGRFETANGGTLLLDEIAEIPLSLQVKLLRVLQEREFERVGGNKTIKVDVRIVASTNRDLLDEVRAGRFREDLYYRLNVVPINLPPLRLRGSDLDDFVHVFLRQLSRKHGKRPGGLTLEAWSKLRGYRWPGNVRELQNVIERAVILAAQGQAIDARDLALPDEHHPNGALSPEIIEFRGNLPTCAEMERRLISAALVRTGNNKTHAARRLGISLRTLRNKLAYYRRLGFDTNRPETLAA